MFFNRKNAKSHAREGTKVNNGVTDIFASELSNKEDLKYGNRRTKPRKERNLKFYRIACSQAIAL